MGKMINYPAELEKEGIAFKKDLLIRELSNFKTGGRVEALVEVKSVPELEAAVKILKKAKTRYLVVGNLTNLLIADGRVDKVFLKLGAGFADLKRGPGKTVYAGAAVKNGKFLNFLAKNGLGGLEFMAGIPGTIGGAVYMNAGAYGKGIGSYVRRVYYVDRNGKPGSMKNRAGMFSYRSSRFARDSSVITGADIKAEKKDMAESLDEMREIIRQRHEKHPWDAACAGSFFKNTPDITAGKLIEMAGLKGLRVGGAMVSTKHGNFLINTGNASFKDVIRLAEKVKKIVYKKFRIKLKEEVVIVK
jgi:UDP-N-acetylmuramate dehydrogenase